MDDHGIGEVDVLACSAEVVRSPTSRCRRMHVATVPEQRLCSVSDPTVIDVCKAEDRCLITLDLDFSNAVCFPDA